MSAQPSLPDKLDKRREGEDAIGMPLIASQFISANVTHNRESIVAQNIVIANCQPLTSTSERRS
jgi:hypothetical protein